MAQQGSLELLSDPVAKALLESVNPAGLHLDGRQSQGGAGLVSLDR